MNISYPYRPERRANRGRWLRPIFGLVGVVVLAGLGAGSAANGSPAYAKDPGQIELGAVLTMTGFGAYYGKYQLAAIKMAVAQVNAAGGIGGQKVHLTVTDSRSSDTGAISALNKLSGSKLSAIVGPVLGTEMLAMLPTIDRSDVPVITISGTRAVTQKGSQDVFRTDAHDGVVKVALIDWIVNRLHLKKVGLSITGDAWGFSGRDTMTAALKTYGFEPVDVETHAPSDTTMTAQLTKLKQHGAQIVVTQGYTPDTATIINEANSLHLGLPIFTSTDGQLAATLPITSAQAVEGVYAAGLVMPDQPYPPNPAVAKWAAQFEKMEGFAPSLYALDQYDGVETLFAAMRKYGTDSTALRKGMHEITYEGFNGIFHSDEYGNMLNMCQIYRFGSHKNAIWVRSVTVPLSKQK